MKQSFRCHINFRRLLSNSHELVIALASSGIIDPEATLIEVVASTLCGTSISPSADDEEDPVLELAPGIPTGSLFARYLALGN